MSFHTGLLIQNSKFGKNCSAAARSSSDEVLKPRGFLLLKKKRVALGKKKCGNNLFFFSAFIEGQPHKASRVVSRWGTKQRAPEIRLSLGS